MSSTTTIPSNRVNRIRRMPLFAKRRNFPFIVSNVVITEENLSGTAWEQEELSLVYSDTRTSGKLSQAAIRKGGFDAAIFSEPSELLSEEFSTCFQYNPAKALPKLFRQLVSIWKSDTKHLSDLTQICNHWTYQNIIKMGRPVIPLLLQELKTNPDYWFSALRKITGQNPVPPEARGKLKDMASAWLEWGKNSDVSW